ncbi:MAG: putative MAPEG superfamily protein [Alphaproteobacteria bacterium]|jgi:uncharacterized MAPEG superfamily protein
MPLIAKIPVAFAMFKQGKYDNKNPRQQQSSLEGSGARAVAAHKNCFEAICYFAPTILLVLALDEHNVYTVKWCVAFVLLRFMYLAFYWANWHILRSIAWAAAMATLVPHYWLLLA